MKLLFYYPLINITKKIEFKIFIFKIIKMEELIVNLNLNDNNLEKYHEKFILNPEIEGFKASNFIYIINDLKINYDNEIYIKLIANIRKQIYVLNKVCNIFDPTTQKSKLKIKEKIFMKKIFNLFNQIKQMLLLNIKNNSKTFIAQKLMNVELDKIKLFYETIFEYIEKQPIQPEQDSQMDSS